MSETAQAEPSVASLLGTLARDTGVLVRQEVELASTEMTLKARRFTREAGMIAAGTAVALLGFAAMLTAGIVALEAVVPLWLSALLVGIAVTGVGYGMVSKGMSGLERLEVLPEKTIKTLQEDVEWAKEQVR